ncbi:hypothetical protein [Chryseobacterium sp. Mn2064]|uniref:hypothetical protein n=1 Tax=Chryseobacterium sp. Mn2064 TaxID=3395263 RepID=UPI003BE6839E
MLQFRIFIISLLLIFITSCSSNKVVGSWKFIEIYYGEIRNTDLVKMKNDSSKYGNGTLTFNKNGTFNSMEDTGTYQRKKELLMMKYKDGTDTARMKISYLSSKYLFLYSTTKASKTWVYEKVESQKK